MSKRITCKRCKGTGNVGGAVVCAGVPGGCFSCLAAGSVYANKFDQTFANVPGEFYGYSYTSQGRTVKQINRCTDDEAYKVSRGVTVTKITEEQARKFFARYGEQTKI